MARKGISKGFIFGFIFIFIFSLSSPGVTADSDIFSTLLSIFNLAPEFHNLNAQGDSYIHITNAEPDPGDTVVFAIFCTDWETTDSLLDVNLYYSTTTRNTSAFNYTSLDYANQSRWVHNMTFNTTTTLHYYVICSDYVDSVTTPANYNTLEWKTRVSSGGTGLVVVKEEEFKIIPESLITRFRRDLPVIRGIAKEYAPLVPFAILGAFLIRRKWIRKIKSRLS